MSAPLEFVRILGNRLRSAGVRFAVTSGMACVHYGLQQTTKDSDWIMAAADLDKLRSMFTGLEGEFPPWRVSYRIIFGAPLEAEFMVHGWTSHLHVWDRADSPAHPVDIFSKPPRGREAAADAEGWATRELVAMMKRTDRDRDWPMVDSLGWQMQLRGEGLGLVHIQDPVRLVQEWQTADLAVREATRVRRPLLTLLERERDPDRVYALIRLERTIWECVNIERYGVYEGAWKRFYRAWRREEDWDWPTAEPFLEQHGRLLAAARRHGLPSDPLAEAGRDELLARALARAAVRSKVSAEEARRVCPPADELLS